MPVDLHPDVVQAIRQLSHTKLGRRYERYAEKNYGIHGWQLAGRTVAGEFSGRSVRSGRGVVSSAGARGPAQFIPSTRKSFIQQYGIDPWRSDAEAIKGLMIHQLTRGGLRGYNPGDPNYPNYILKQRLNASDRKALRGLGGFDPGSPPSTDVSVSKRSIPGQSFAPDRQDLRRQLLLGGDLDMQKLLEYKRQLKSLQDIPSRTESGDIKVDRRRGQTVRFQDGRRGTDPVPNVGGGIYEVFYDPLGKYWDSGTTHKGGIGGHSDHVHVSADTKYVEALGRVAQQMGLHVSGERKYGGTPHSGHTEGSFHYKDMAIDVSGDPAKMRKFARIVINTAKQGRGR